MVKVCCYGPQWLFNGPKIKLFIFDQILCMRRECPEKYFSGCDFFWSYSWLRYWPPKLCQKFRTIGLNLVLMDCLNGVICRYSRYRVIEQQDTVVCNVVGSRRMSGH